MSCGVVYLKMKCPYCILLDPVTGGTGSSTSSTHVALAIETLLCGLKQVHHRSSVLERMSLLTASNLPHAERFFPRGILPELTA